MKIAFLLGDINGISGGTNVIVEHASRLQERGHDVTLVCDNAKNADTARWQPRARALIVRDFFGASSARYDFAIATWWLTYFQLPRLDARVYAYFNQSLESRFRPEPSEKRFNRLTYELPLLFITEADWLAEYIAAVQPSSPCLLVRNGLSRDWFPPASTVVPPDAAALRVLVEGPWGVGFKGVPETFAHIERAAQRVPIVCGWLSSNTAGHRPAIAGRPVRIHESIPISEVANVLRQYDVMVKLSRVEGVFGPPIEMMSQGGTVIARVVSGCDEYVRHGDNALLVPPYAEERVTDFLIELREDPATLDALKRGALATGAQHSTWDAASETLEAGLLALAARGYDNAVLRPGLAALAAARDIYDGAIARYLWQPPPTYHHLGPLEQKMLHSYRELKRRTPKGFASLARSILKGTP